MVRQRDVHDVDIRFGEELVVGAESPADAVLRGEGSRPSCVAAGDRDHLAPLAAANAADKARCDAAGAQDSPAERGHAPKGGPRGIVTIGAAT